MIISDVSADGIGVFDNVCSKEECEYYINCFEEIKAIGGEWRHGHPQVEDSRVSLLPPELLPSTHRWSDNKGVFITRLINDVYPIYCKKFPTVKETPLDFNHMKIQKTPKGGGYHVWHYEKSVPNYCRRLWVGMLYLNDVEEGGETEFLAQRRRVKPKQGRCVIFPASYTHVHRGGLVISNDKYAITVDAEYAYLDND